MQNKPFDAVRFRRDLLTWYKANHRKLPWRKPPGQSAVPYHVLVSEAMLQQTQVATVINYFHRFIDAFPTIKKLAAADEQQVLRLWQGLGYYRRARNLHRCAGVIVDEHNARIPNSVDQLLTLPGIGRYTAGAIASIAYARCEPLLDGNVARVLARLHEITQPVDQTATTKKLWQLAESMLPKRSRTYTPGDYNQAMMELGATICTPRNPHCLTCPAQKQCSTFQSGRTEEIPVPVKRTKLKPMRCCIVAVEHAGQFLFQKRSDTGLWSGMWQLLTADDVDKKFDLAHWTSQALGVDVKKPEKIGRFIHLTTHRRIAFEVFLTRLTTQPSKKIGTWRLLDNINDLPLPNPQLKALAHVAQRIKVARASRP